MVRSSSLKPVAVGLALYMMAMALLLMVLIAQDIRSIKQTVDTRRYLDCVPSSTSSELLCKQVTVSDPPYQP